MSERAARPSTAWILLALLVLSGAIGAYYYPHGPLLAGWLVLALSFGTWFAFAGSATLQLRIRRLVILHCALIVASLFTSQMAARRLTSATHLRFNGVLVEGADSVVVASGMQGVDVVLPTISSTQVPWRLTLVRQGSAWAIAPGADVEQIRVLPLPQSRLGKRYTVLNGVVLASPGDSVAVINARTGFRDVLTLRNVDGHASVHSRTYGAYELEPVNHRLDSRFARLLRNGTPIGVLDGKRGSTSPFDRFVRVQRLSLADDVNNNVIARATFVQRFFDPSPRVLLSAAAPFVLEEFGAAAAKNEAASMLPDSARIEVRHMGGLWRFDIAPMQREATAAQGLAIRFERNPRPLDTPLPSGNSCTVGVACGLLSLRRLPLPIAHVSLDAAGFDPSRFALLARLREADGGVSVLLPRDSILIPLAGSKTPSFTVIPVTTIAAQNGSEPAERATGEVLGPRHWLLMSATSHHTDGAGQVLLVGVGVALLLLLVHRLIGAIAIPQYARISNEGAIALGLNALLTLLLARLIVGARVTFFAPFNAAGLNTAIGMWVAVAIVTTGLLAWSRWAPVLLKFFYTLSQQRSLRRSTISAAARASIAESRATHAGAPASRSRVGSSIVYLLLPLILLAMVAVEPVLFGAIAGIAVVLTWFLIAWVSSFAGPLFHSFESGPFEVIEFHSDGMADDATGARGGTFLRGLPERSLLFLAFLWTLVLVDARLVVVAIALPLLLHLVRRTSVGARLAGSPESQAAPTLVLIGQVTSLVAVAMLRMTSENGAMAAFLFIILVALVSVRSGRALAARMPRTSESVRLPWWTIALSLVVPMILLLPLAVIDMGLLLVMAIPMGGAALLAVGVHRLSVTGKISAGVASFALLYVLFFKVLFPDVSQLNSNDPRQRAARFEQMQRFAGLRMPRGVGESFERAAARAVATRNQDAAERLLISAPPGAARDLLLPSIEQVWASKAYAASGAFGSGLGLAPVTGRGIAEAVSYAENSYSVYILQEHGWIGGLSLLSAYLVFAVAVLLAVRKAAVIRTESMRATLALFLVATLIVIIPAVYVALSNLGVVPITGQNMPFLGLNAWSDVTLCAGVIGILITGAIRTEGIRA